jgi:hypothetical protein
VKTPEQQAQLMHRARDLLIPQRTQAINALRSHLAELGIVAPQGYDGLKALLAIIADSKDTRLPENARVSLSALVAQIASCQGAIEKRLLGQHRRNDDSKRLETIPGIGLIGASAIVATVPDASIFKTGRDFAAWVGIVSRQDSTGGKQRLGPISKQGDRYLRRILIVGAFCRLEAGACPPREVPLGRQPLGAQEGKSCRGGIDQQNGAHRLGGADQEGRLPGTSNDRHSRVRASKADNGGTVVVAALGLQGDDGIDAKRLGRSIGKTRYVPRD